MRVLTVGAICAAILLLGCEQTGRDGELLKINSEDTAAISVLKEAAARARQKQLSKPIKVVLSNSNVASEDLLEIYWDATSLEGRDAQRLSDDALLDKAKIRFLSADGMPVFYNYCFIDDGDHAQSATHFCTVTLIAAMKEAKFKPTL